MPWKECNKMSERVRFIGRLMDGEKMTDVCREFGISRVTGYKIWKRYEREGLRAASDRSTRPWRLANQTSSDVETAILDVKAKYSTWGAPKILSYLQRKREHAKLPARSTVHAILDRHGLVKHRSRRGRPLKMQGTRLMSVEAPNELWCADFKGQFKMGDGKYCYPLTITDQHSRFLLSCEALESSKEKDAIEVFKNVFEEYGLPGAIRTDNGLPFAARSLFGLSKLSVMWLRLGIEIERIEPGHPEQNGRHERMHRTLKESVTKPAGKNILQQQEMLEGFLKMFNEERPHEALLMKCPSDVYVPSTRPYPKVFKDIDYSGFDLTRRISACGSIKAKGDRKIFISDVFAGQEVGVEEEEEGVWAVTFMNFKLGYFGSEHNSFSPGPNPFLKIINPKV